MMRRVPLPCHAHHPRVMPPMSSPCLARGPTPFSTEAIGHRSKPETYRAAPTPRRLLSRGLLDRGDVPGERRAPHVAYFGTVEPARAVHRRAVIPHHEIAHTPRVRIDKPPLCRELGKVAQKH